MQSTPLLPLLSGPLWPGVVAPDKGPIYVLNRTNWIAWNRNVFDRTYILTACLFKTELFEMEMFFDIETVLTLN